MVILALIAAAATLAVVFWVAANPLSKVSAQAPVAAVVVKVLLDAVAPTVLRFQLRRGLIKNQCFSFHPPLFLIELLFN